MMNFMNFSSSISSFLFNSEIGTGAVVSLSPVAIGIFIGITLLMIVLIVAVIILEHRVRRLTAGKNGASLEEAITAIGHGLEEEVRFKREMEKYLSQVERRLTGSTRSIETVRFNAFSGMGVGGNQSFATALLNERGDGIIISTLNARERMSIFGKPIKNFSSEFDLTPEEQEALDRAHTALATPLVTK